MVNQAERQVLFTGVGLSDQNRLNAGHLAIVGGSGDGEEDRLSEAGEDGEADEEEDFLGLVGMNAYHNHSNYGSYKQCSCHTRLRKGLSERGYSGFPVAGSDCCWRRSLFPGSTTSHPGDWLNNTSRQQTGRRATPATGPW